MGYDEKIESLLKFLEKSKIADLLTRDQYKQILEINIVHWDEALKEVMMPYISDLLKEENDKFQKMQSKQYSF